MNEISHRKNRRFVIGDVHGHYKGLMVLMEAIAPTSDDQVYFLGDLIDRGPNSAQVVEFVRRGKYDCLLGNHEQMFLNVLTNKGQSSSIMQSWLYSGGQATLASYQSAKIPSDDLEWLQNLPTYLDLGDVWLTHAGVDPNKSVAQQTTDELCWIREAFHSIEQPYFTDKMIIVGHTITFTMPDVAPGKLAQGRGWIDIDTGAYHPRSGWLTALDITNNLVYQANVFNYHVRTLPLEAATTMINPRDIRGSDHHKKRA
ncbi:metallophosphoesterase family protein [Cronbergia sp. UHCC 0137]|uniref:metallophosphoesterase family protein n=1 Tax=Cronbergia sp. UHCC 0137 TaxID=3110239 RepID=UPI002B2141A3|nr:metallophosphoesterase family protein [Cronbergia sp. UHCC 0137]MEA5616302.1 metallophosphoesterase family protein [Cronbergia sp. UHCC 0137]